MYSRFYNRVEQIVSYTFYAAVVSLSDDTHSSTIPLLQDFENFLYEIMIIEYKIAVHKIWYIHLISGLDRASIYIIFV